MGMQLDYGRKELAGAAHNTLLDLLDNADINGDVVEAVDALLHQEGRQVAVPASVLHDEAQKVVGVHRPQAALLGEVDGGLDRL